MRLALRITPGWSAVCSVVLFLIFDQIGKLAISSYPDLLTELAQLPHSQVSIIQQLLYFLTLVNVEKVLRKVLICQYLVP
jgi:hypothetical protein